MRLEAREQHRKLKNCLLRRWGVLFGIGGSRTGREIEFPFLSLTGNDCASLGFTGRILICPPRHDLLTFPCRSKILSTARAPPVEVAGVGKREQLRTEGLTVC